MVTMAFIKFMACFWFASAVAVGFFLGRIYKPIPKPRIGVTDLRRRQELDAFVRVLPPPDPDPRSNPNVHIRDFGRRQQLNATVRRSVR